jgi:hypothetical protein
MGANGRSDNATFGKSATANINDKETLYVKRAMIGYNATDWLKLEGGRLENPLYTTPMVWDADLTWEGLVEKANFKLGNADVFLTAAQTQYQGDRKNFSATTADTITTEMFAFQAGLKYAFTDKATGKAALTYTNYNHNTSTTSFKPGLSTVIEPAQTHIVLLVSNMAGLPPILSFLAQGSHGITGIGIHDEGTKTGTGPAIFQFIGLAGDVQFPKAGTFNIGTKSI